MVRTSSLPQPPTSCPARGTCSFSRASLSGEAAYLLGLLQTIHLISSFPTTAVAYTKDLFRAWSVDRLRPAAILFSA